MNFMPHSTFSSVRDNFFLNVQVLVIRILAFFFRLCVRQSGGGRVITHVAGEKNKVIVEAGHLGWELIEKQELLLSLQEYLGEVRVVKFVVPKTSDRFLKDFAATVPEGISHYLVDPRSINLTFWNSIRFAWLYSRIFNHYDICPIILISDLRIFSARMFCGIVTRNAGLIWGLNSSEQLARAIGSRNVIGPMPMPFSMSTLEEIKEVTSNLSGVVSDISIGFYGSLYEPRTSLLRDIESAMRDRGLHLHMVVRKLGGKRIPNREYWQNLLKTKILVTTADQSSGDSAIGTWPKHLIWRYTEALVSGQLLLAPYVEGIDRWFVPGEHFVVYGTPEDAAASAEHYLCNELDRIRIAHAGHLRVKSLIANKEFWRAIDDALTESGQIPILPQ